MFKHKAENTEKFSIVVFFKINPGTQNAVKKMLIRRRNNG